VFEGEIEMTSTYTAQSQRCSTRRSAGRRPGPAKGRGLSRFEIATLTVITILLIVGTVGIQHPGESATATQAVQVRTGDTLWSIAQDHPVPGLTTAQTAELIARNNRIEGRALGAGQDLLVPLDSGVMQQVASR
jgi:hypothetical protein